MNNKLSLHECDHIELESYLDGKVADHASLEVEEHLAKCASCQEAARATAASGEQWQQTRRLLSRDEFDRGDCLSSVIELATGEAAELHRHDAQSAGDAAMLSREIDGWLDPTDDPNSLGRFAGYEITGIVGHGGMGIVLKGFEGSLNRFVAIKVLAPRLATNGTARKRFAREAQAAAAVIHENVIAIHRVDHWHGLPFLVMPYLVGVSLQKRIDDEGPLSIEATLRIGSQIADGLAAAHAHGLVHRDIKPANIMLDRGVERVTITDFGLARAIDDASVTRTGIIAGTPQYMSPEQAQAKAVDARSDLFSLGSVLYAMGTGRCPFRDEDSNQILQRIISEPARGMRELDSSIPDWFENLVNRLHAKSPSDRPQSADEVKRLLDACLLHVTQKDHPLPSELQASIKRKSQRRWWITGGLGLAIAALLWFMIPLFLQAPVENEDEAGDGAGQVAADANRVKGKQIGSALGKPIYEGDFNREDKTGKDLMLLVVRLLEESYCKKHPGLEPGEEVHSRIKNDERRAATVYWIRRSRMQKHLYEKYGGRVLLSAFGAMAFDGQKKWLEEQEKLGEFQITDPQLRATLYDFWKQDYGWKLTEDPSKIKAAFDPAIEEGLISSVAHVPAGAASDTKLKLVGTVFGKPLHVHEQSFNDDVELGKILHDLFITRLEENYRKQHPEVDPTDAEIDRLTALSEKRDEQLRGLYRKAVDEVVSKQQGLDPKSDRYLELQSERKVIEHKLKNSGGRTAAAFLARPLKFQQHLFDNYGGGRALQTPQGAIAFDAQQRWVEEREGLGEFQIADPKIREIFYDHWTKAQQRHGAMLIDEPKQKGWFNPRWLGQSDDKISRAPIPGPVAGDPVPGPAVGTKIVVTQPQRMEAGPRKFPTEQVADLIAKQKGEDATADTELQRITGLDFSAETVRESRRAWLDWWSHEQSNIQNALDGTREFIIIGKITDPEGQPIPGATIQADVASESNTSGRIRLGSTISDVNGSCILFFGYFKKLSPDEPGPTVTFTAKKPPGYAARPQDAPRTLILYSGREEDGGAKKAVLHPRRPRAMKFVLHPTTRLRVQVVDPDGKPITPEKLSMRLGPPDAPLPEDAEAPEQSLRPLKGGVFFATLLPPQSIEFLLQETKDSAVHRSTTRLVAKEAGDVRVQLIYSPGGKLEIALPK